MKYIRLLYCYSAVGRASYLTVLETLIRMKLADPQRIAACPWRTQVQHIFGIYEPLAYPGYLHAILAQMPAGPFDHPCRHGETCGQIGSVMQAVGVLAQRMRTLLDRGTLGLWQVVRSGTELEARGNAYAAPAQHRLKTCAHRDLSFQHPRLVQCPGAFHSDQYPGRDTGATPVGVFGKLLGPMAINGSN